MHNPEPASRRHPRRRRGLIAAAAAGTCCSLLTLSAQVASAADGKRIEGATRFETAASIALTAHPTGAARVYLARADDFPDALAAGALSDGPVLLVPQSGAVPGVVTSTIASLAPTSVVALGGTAAISDSVLSASAAGRATSRLAGPTRFETAVEISRAAFASSATTVYLARADSFPDALAAGMVTDGPILLVPSSGPVPEVVTAEVQRLGATRVVALGGPAVLSDQVLSAVAAGKATSRLFGASRIETAVAVSAATFPQGAATVYLARADAFPDALAAGALTGGPILLAPSCGAVPAAVAAEITRLGAATVVALGSSSALCDALLTTAARGSVEQVTYLSDLETVGTSSFEFWQTGAERVSGQVLARSWSVNVRGRAQRSIGFDLGRSRSRLQGTLGMADTSPDAARDVVVDVVVDDAVVSTYDVGFGESVDVDVDVSGGLRLRVDIRGVTERDGTARVVLGDFAVR